MQKKLIKKIICCVALLGSFELPCTTIFAAEAECTDTNQNDPGCDAKKKAETVKRTPLPPPPFVEPEKKASVNEQSVSSKKHEAAPANKAKPIPPAPKALFPVAPQTTTPPPMESTPVARGSVSVSAAPGEAPEKKETPPPIPIMPGSQDRQRLDHIEAFQERKNFVTISKTDINRFVCENGEMAGAIYSEDKGIQINRTGSNAFVRVIPDSHAYSLPWELYLMCGKTLYSFIVETDRITPAKVILKDGDAHVADSLEIFKGKDREQNIKDLIQAAYKESWDSNWKAVQQFQVVRQTKDFKATWYMSVDTFTPWTIDLFIIQGLSENPVTIDDQWFIDANTVAVSVFDSTVSQGRISKVAVIRSK